jgi:CSLREA domain-containing protein
VGALGAGFALQPLIGVGCSAVSVLDRALRLRWLPVLSLAACLCALAVPAAASAVEYTVNSTLDGPDKALGTGGCETATLGECTLRAAIEESDNSTGLKDTIKFAAAFNGEFLTDTIGLGASFPLITDPVTIDGDGVAPCLTTAGVNGPCVGVERTVAGPALGVENANGVTIEGLAVTGASTGINVLNSSEDFTARNDWLGVKLDGTAATNTTGIFLDPNSNGAQIGGTAAAERNVFANNSFEGLDIQGASQTQVSGNYFGVKPDGVTQAANGKDIEVTSSFTVEATDNEIGAELSPEALATPACDGACNVISGALSMGVDLLGEGGGEEPPGKATTIQGNYIGLTATGGALGNATIGVQAGKSHETMIGGEAAGSANHINGGTYGISASSLGVGADELWIWNNLIGLNPAGTATLAPPSVDAIFNSGEGVPLGKGARIYNNRISMSGGIAIEQHSIGALIHENQIGRGSGGQSLSGGGIGIKLWGPSISASTVELNRVENATANGILVENNNNLLIGNTIVGSGEAGIRVQDFLTLASTGTSIGGEVEGLSENTISDSGGDAIEVAGEEDDDTQIARNKGSGNAGLFIDLGADGPGNDAAGPNDGIQAPEILSPDSSGVSGAGARPGATVRVFRKATSSPGEIESFLGKATADIEGKWSVTYASAIPGGTNIAATQSDIEGTSELVTAVTATVVIDGGCGFMSGPNCPDGGDKDKGGDKNKDSGKGKGKGKADKKAPETTIVKGPKARSHKRTAKFRFVSSEANSTFQCKLDRKPFKPCRSPKKYKRLRPGKHVFQVRAIDAAGNRDKSPAKKTFRVLG